MKEIFDMLVLYESGKLIEYRSLNNYPPFQVEDHLKMCGVFGLKPVKIWYARTIEEIDMNNPYWCKDD